MEPAKTQNLTDILTIEHIKSIGKFIQRIDLKPAEIDEFLNLLKALQGLNIFYQNQLNKK
jgi:hypothetical protein